MIHNVKAAHHYPEVGVPLFWPLGLALELEQKNMKFLHEVAKIDIDRPMPKWASPNKVIYSLHTFTLRDFSGDDQGDEIPVFILPPYAGHTSIIADFHKKQSLVETLLKHGIKRVILVDWHSATPDMKDYDIDNYLAELHVAISGLGSVHLIGLCQGGWMAGLYAARFPQHVTSLVLAGAPIDTHAGNGAIEEYASTLPLSFFEELVAAGGGLLKGSYMLEGFKNMHPQQQFLDKYVDLYENIDDPSYIKRTENFERWFEYTINLPGRWYLQVIRELFKENRFAKGKFIGLGKKLNLKDIICPLYLLAGASDDITPKDQVFNADKYFGTAKRKIVKDLADGGHIGLFMGSKALTINWPKITTWLKNNEG